MVHCWFVGYQSGGGSEPNVWGMITISGSWEFFFV